MSKVWEWVKKNWKWLLLPFWIVSLALVWIFRGGSRTLLPVSGTTDQASATLSAAKDKALEDFRARLEDMARKADERLKGASKEQVEAFKELKDRPLEEVASWIDKF